MTHYTVVVLGSAGMLGAMVTQVLAQEKNLTVYATVRNADEGSALRDLFPTVQPLPFSVSDGTQALENLFVTHRPSWVVNAIGVIKPYISEKDPQQIQRAIEVNGLFPHWLATTASTTGARVIQIATDCVYSGHKGQYTESDLHDALDVYGKTKSIGEVPHPSVLHLRCSIIGPERKSFKSLLEWFLRQPRDAAVSGFTNHDWNGVTTYHYARIVTGIITHDVRHAGLHHVVPGAALTKHAMLESFARHFRRDDITIRAVEAAERIDRTLATADPGRNSELWAAAGYTTPPSVEEMIAELSRHPLQGKV